MKETKKPKPSAPDSKTQDLIAYRNTLMTAFTDFSLLIDGQVPTRSESPNHGPYTTSLAIPYELATVRLFDLEQKIIARHPLEDLEPVSERLYCLALSLRLLERGEPAGAKIRLDPEGGHISLGYYHLKLATDFSYTLADLRAVNQIVVMVEAQYQIIQATAKRLLHEADTTASRHDRPLPLRTAFMQAEADKFKKDWEKLIRPPRRPAPP